MLSLFYLEVTTLFVIHFNQKTQPLNFNEVLSCEVTTQLLISCAKEMIFVEQFLLISDFLHFFQQLQVLNL
jgi:hypothetical protein